MLMGCLAPINPPAFATLENAFFLRTAREWEELCVDSGFSQCAAETVTHDILDASGNHRQLHTIRIQVQV